MNFFSWLAVGAGGIAGCWLRWWFNITLTPLFPTLPLGTLASNLVAGFLMGISMELFARYASIPPEIRLLVTTGFLGGLSTFSTFSADVVTLLSRQEYLWGTIAIIVHVAGSIVLTVLGILAARLLFSGGAS
ncbi:MAG TPA: fluoride efflux transporter CrcB [Burkholderiales bacterium]|nr:fluoride efflux transporter CrcB [Burkholderiales bacterium]